MKNTNSKAFRQKVFNYLIASTCDVEGMSDQAIVQHLYDRLHSEYGRRKYPHLSEQERYASWLSGMPLNVACYNGHIAKVLEHWHECTLDEKQLARAVDNWFPFLGFKLRQMFAHYGVNSPSSIDDTKRSVGQ